MSEPGSITFHLEEEVKRELRQRGIVVWLDKDSAYTAYVDRLAERYTRGEFFAPVIGFRGSYLEMLLALEPYGNGLDREPLLIHMPGHTEESVRETPILELYRAGYRYRRALDTLIREAATGRVSPSELESYLNDGSIDLASAEVWLQQAIGRPRDGLAAYLENLNPEWILDGLLGADPSLRSKITDEASLLILKDHLHRRAGMSDGFLQLFHGTTSLSFQDLAEAFAGWLMCVEYVNDLTRLPRLEELKPLKQLPAVLQKTCAHLVQHFRQRYPDTYESMASIVEGRLEQELKDIQPEDLGKIDTFGREETVVLEAAVQALLQGEWTKALAWAESRAAHPSFWIERNKTARLEWLLIHDAATLGHSIDRAERPLESCRSLRQALDYYTGSGYRIDLAHRHFEQRRLKLLEPTLTHYASLQEAGDRLQIRYRDHADRLARDFAAICESEGFLPEPDLQQRTLYDEVVHPLTRANRKVAYFLIDAFRYEMAAELVSEFESAGTTVLLKGRYAELPTITAVGMNALAPVSKAGRLTLAGSEGFNGFRTGEYTVRAPDGRFRAINEKSIDRSGAGRERARAIELSEVRDRTVESLKKAGLGKVDLLVVHSKEIDDAGEANAGLATFETCLQHLKTAWSHLRSIGFNEFVFTADHGFLLQDRTTRIESYGSKRDPCRRYVLMAEPRSETGTVTVSLSALQYEGRFGYLLFRRDTANFATGNPGANFVHGGNSLQERVVPVLTVSHRHASETTKLKYIVEVEAEPEMLGYSRLRLRVKPAPGVQLSFIGARTIGLSLRVPDRPDIQLTIKDAPGIEVKNQVLRVPVEGDRIEVLFDLKGARGEKVPIEVYHPEGKEEIEPTITKDLFAVSGTLRAAERLSPTEVVISPEWPDRFEDEGVRQVFLHLQRHGSITEVELTRLLGNARKVRRFSMDFEEHLQRVPFSVRIETTPNGKRYVRQN